MLILCLLAGTVSIRAEKMSVESFELLEKDLTANTYPNIVYDLNGEKCALIKIETNEHNFMFDVGQLGVIKTVNQNADHPGEIWLYVPYGVKKITIQHPIFETIRDYDLGKSLQKGKTYLLKLTSDEVNTLVVDYTQNQSLKTQIEPKNATFYINGIKQQLNADGICEILLPFGSHSYRVICDNYHSDEGKISINSKDSVQKLNIRLKQAFGYLTIDNKDLAGADVFVDDNLVGIVPLINCNVKSGSHELKIKKKFYHSYSQTIEVKDSAFIKVGPMLNPNYAEVKLSVSGDNSVQLYDNGELLGNSPWNGKMEAGIHLIEAKKVSHKNSTVSINVKAGEKIDKIIDAPTPIYGTFELTSNPEGASVFIDKKNVGQTPYITNTLLVGHHNVELVKKGCKNESIEIKIEENKATRENVTLTSYCTATIYSEPSRAHVSINGEFVGVTPFQLNHIAGDYKISVSSYRYTTNEKKYNLDGNTKDIKIKLHKNYIRRKEFYMQAGYDVVGLKSFRFGLGCYIKNFNIEANYILGQAESENIYWNNKNAEYLPCKASYKPSGYICKLGYGIRINSRLRFTPQIGVQYLMLKESANDIRTYNSVPSEYYYYVGSLAYLGIADNSKAISASIGARINLALFPCIGISVCPEYKIIGGQSDGYKAISEISNEIKSYASGFGCNVAVNLYF